MKKGENSLINKLLSNEYRQAKRGKYNYSNRVHVRVNNNVESMIQIKVTRPESRSYTLHQIEKYTQ